MTFFAAIGESSEWAKEGGIIGLVLFALFGLVFVFIRVSDKKDTAHGKFIKDLLEEERNERKETRLENSENMRGLTQAIKDLTDTLKK